MSQKEQLLSFFAFFTIVLTGILPGAVVHADDINVAQGWNLIEHNNIAAAATVFRADLKMNPRDTSAWHGLACIDWMHNDPAVGNDLEAAVETGPDLPQSWVDWETITVNVDYFGMTAREVGKWRALANNTAAPAQIRGSATEAVAEYDRLSGAESTAESVWNSLHYVRAWKTIGPFENISKSGFKKLYEPEVDGVVLTAHDTGKSDLPIKWLDLPAPQPDGMCVPGAYYGDNASSIYYSATAVRSDRNRQAVLWYSPVGASKVWLNRKLILTDDIYRQHTWGVGDTFSVPVTLAAGLNTLVVKTADDDVTTGAFSLRFCSTDGVTPLALPAEPTLASGPLEPALANTPNAQPALVELAQEAPPTRLSLEALANLEDNYSDYNAAATTVDAAIELAPDDAWLEWEKADILTSNGQADDGRTLRDNARAANPGNLLAQEDYVDDDNTNIPDDQKVTLLRSLLQTYPDSPLLLVSLAGVLSDQKLVQQSLNTYARAVIAGPGTYSAESLSNAYDEADRHTEELSFDQAALRSLPGDTVLLDNEADVFGRIGKTQLAVGTYRRSILFGDQPIQDLESISSAYSDAHDTPKAIATIQQTLLLRPYDADIREKLADKYVDAGETGAAISCYVQSLKLDPSKLEIRDKLAALEHEKPPLELVPGIAAAPLIQAAQTANTSQPTFGAVREILDEGREVVYADGATDLHIHAVIKIADRSAIDRYSSYNLLQTTSTSKIANLSARLIKAGGKIVYPDVDDDATTVDFPSLDVGDIIDVEYDVTDYQSGALAHNFWSEWYFDAKTEDVDISEFSLITPKSMAITFAQHGAVPPIVQHDIGNWTVRQWKATGILARQAEQLSAPGSDSDDWLDISTVPSWHTVISWYADLANDACTPDDEIRAKAAELTTSDTTDDQRIRHIVAYVRSIRYQSTPFRLSAYVPTDGKEVIRDSYGDCKDKAALLCSLLKCVGINAQMILLSPRTFGITEHLPSPRFDHAIARIMTPTGWQWVDATADQLGYGCLPFNDQGVPALIIDPATNGISTSPVLDPAVEVQTITTKLTLAPDGSVDGERASDYTGNMAWAMRTYLQTNGAARRSQILHSLVAQQFPGSTSDIGSVSGVDLPDSDIGIKITFHQNTFGSIAGPLMLLKLPWGETLSYLANALETPTPRTTDVELGPFRSEQVEIVTIALPNGFSAYSLDPPVKLTSPWGECDFNFSSNAGTITATLTMLFNAQRISAAEVPDLITYLNKAVAEATKQIVLKGPG